jgi:hypothetical protein
MASAAAAKKWRRLFQCCARSHVHQAQIRLVDEGRGFEGLAGLLLSEFPGRELAQLLVDEGQELLSGVGIAFLDGGQDACNLAHRRTRTLAKYRRPVCEHGWESWAPIGR